MSHPASQIIRDEHRALAAVLRSVVMLAEQGPGDQPDRFFDVLRAMLFYIDEFPERLHHPKESNLLFPKIARAEPAMLDLIGKLEADHMDGEGRVRELQHLLLAWELIGESRRQVFVDGAAAYIKFYLEHMRIEETHVLPAAERSLSKQEWDELEQAFRTDPDPLATGMHDSSYDRLFTRIVLSAPAPIGVGAALVKERA
ncbi:MAG: hemerythrin [Ramlibacter sp.]|jgi:hemerythrin-like domain-containing protein|nr:hemerythrin [Ramlibacter sp.]